MTAAPLSTSPPTQSSSTPSPSPTVQQQQVLPVTKAAFEAVQEQLFNALQPPLAQLMQGSLVAGLPAVLSAIRHVSSTRHDYPLERQLADYILFPLFHHLRSQDVRNLPQATQETVLELLWFVWQRIPTIPTLLQSDPGGKSHDVPLVYDSAAMQSLMIVASTALPRSPEDIAHCSVAVLLVILGHPSVPDPFSSLTPLAKDELVTDVKTRPDRALAISRSTGITSLSSLLSSRMGNLLFFQLVTNLFDLLASSKLLRLRQLALVAIHDLLLVVAQDPNVAGLALPSVMSKFTLLVCEPNPNSSLVTLALDIMSRLIPFALQKPNAVDDETDPSTEINGPDEPNEALAVWQKFASKSGLLSSASSSACSFDIPTRSFPLSSAEFSRDSHWFTTTAANVATTLIGMYSKLVPSTASPDVLVSACNLAHALTRYTSRHLAAAIPHLFTFAAACTLSEFTQVQSAASSVLDAVFSLPAHFQDIPSRALSHALDGLTTLASISDEDKVTRLRQLQGCLVAFKSSSVSSASASDLRTTFMTSMGKTIRAWQSLLVIDSETPLRSETDSRFRRWNFIAFHQLPVADAAWDAIGAWASTCGEAVVQGVLSKLIESVNREKDFDRKRPVEPVFVTKLSADPMADLRNQLLAARFAAHTDKPDQAQQEATQRTDRRRALYALYAAVLAANPTSAWLLQHATAVLDDPPIDPIPPALVLTGLEQSKLVSYTEFVRTHLAVILVHSTSMALPCKSRHKHTLIGHLSRSSSARRCLTCSTSTRPTSCTRCTWVSCTHTSSLGCRKCFWRLHAQRHKQKCHGRVAARARETRHGGAGAEFAERGHVA
ncbi:hypothetical protein BCR44DRAFT_1282587 [Catenaria anguillulae PL171]|uniref:Uncharacterized protein n=1 Tax=Catenaria anguillulae PL171 TaxID=765915 RepID=A0A1Y2HYM8_9FUNG|nr:hypothetical protein BCR44DRAFT_1282587 [Catenaria anguillulae PL171]